MGVYIKGMKLPESALKCPFRDMTLNEYGNTFEFICDVRGWTSLDKRFGYKCPDCPLIEVFLEDEMGITDFDI